MLSASRSDSYALATRKRKAEDLDAGALFTAVLNRLRQHRGFAAMEQDDWEDATSEILLDAKLPECAFPPRPFTDALPFYQELFGKDTGDILVAEDLELLRGVEDSDSSFADRYHEAAAALRENTLWKSVKEHVLIENETSCRTAIDLVLLTAMELAQQQIAESPDVDDALFERHSLGKCERNGLDSDAREVRSWVVLLQELEITDQELLPGMFLHGIFDYLLAVVPAQKVRYTAKFVPTFLTWSHMYGMPDPAQHIDQSLASVVQAKSGKPMCGKKAWAEVTAQGAALKRPSVINTLTDGLKWKFVRVSKTPDGLPPSPPSQLSDLPSTSSAPRRRKSDRLAEKLPALPTITERKPFNAAQTRSFDIFEARDLAIILRLLELAILSSSEEFLKQAAAR
ncbi:hypothetical protein B0H15DRAFT_934263 [Mycena belliarum]|uniref:Uncharacterized protein n=1 Tax=Mycena belliarum TaxID=1033014 RepID=A0AAD6TR18_9AGAR|nr:hypothetical protein B0H15DRAFT_934263 [Mycena belliae]